MKEEPVVPARWQAVLEQMFAELRSGSPRAEAYWAQQLAFGPVFFFAVLLAVRKGGVAPADLALLRQMVPLALSLLGALPDGSDGDPASLLLLARRQARALELGRRRHLARLAARLGLEMSRPPYDPVPRRLQRPYELIGWVPPRPSTDHETASQNRSSVGWMLDESYSVGAGCLRPCRSPGFCEHQRERALDAKPQQPGKS